MKVETYEIEEIKNECGALAADHEATELIKKLELKGQAELLEPDSETRFPYPKMDKEQLFTYTNAFPEHVKVDAYNRGIIPLRVLQVIAFCKTMPQIKTLEVWHTAIPKQDPILVGIGGEWGNQIHFLLARWGEALAPYEELRQRSVDAYKAKYRAAMLQIKSEVDGILDHIEAFCQGQLAQNDTDMPSFYK